MNLKNCDVIYFKSKELQNLINHNLRGKIIVSDFPEFFRLCNIYGIIHVLNTNDKKIPEGIDCILCNSRDLDLESRINRNELGIPVIYQGMHQKWCGICGKLSGLEGHIGKFCSEACMKKVSGFTMNNVAESLRDLNDHNKKVCIKFDKNLSNKLSKTQSNEKQKSKDKFQQSMVKEAQRVEFAYRKESYKNEMRQPSHRKTKIVRKKEESTQEVKFCKSMIKGGSKRCGNRALEGSDYCGISSHKESSF